MATKLLWDRLIQTSCRELNSWIEKVEQRARNGIYSLAFYSFIPLQWGINFFLYQDKNIRDEVIISFLFLHITLQSGELLLWFILLPPSRTGEQECWAQPYSMNRSSWCWLAFSPHSHTIKPHLHLKPKQIILFLQNQISETIKAN